MISTSKELARRYDDVLYVFKKGKALVDKEKQLFYESLMETVLNLEYSDYAWQLFVVNESLNVIKMLKEGFDARYVFNYLTDLCNDYESTNLAKCISLKASILSKEADAFFVKYQNEIEQNFLSFCPYLPAIIHFCDITFKKFKK